MSCHENAKKRRFHGWTNPVLINENGVLGTLVDPGPPQSHEPTLCAACMGSLIPLHNTPPVLLRNGGASGVGDEDEEEVDELASSYPWNTAAQRAQAWARARRAAIQPPNPARAQPAYCATNVDQISAPTTRLWTVDAPPAEKNAHEPPAPPQRRTHVMHVRTAS
ncbi:hypothetical protein B0H14DRAFT_3535952 [Mycena olivaceomarginata]|nr:hypothetical protein B0H14DRAFT_3535952 [Mycena olivaceomarginata]